VARDRLSAPSRLALFLALLAGACSARPPAPSPPAVEPAVERRPTVGLALGSGGARGFAHVGVLRVLEREGIPVDLVVGSSVGSLIGALYADTGRVLDAELAAAEIERDDVYDYGALSLLAGGLARGEGIERFLAAHLQSATIEAMPVRFGAVATELRTGRTVVFDRGPVARAVRASCAIPGIFPPALLGGESYVDGAITAPVPARLARERGAEVVIAVAIPAAVPDRAPAATLGVVLQSIEILSTALERAESGAADVLIAPAVGDVAADDFTQKKRLIEAGEAAARAALPAIRAALRAKTRLVPASAAR
jgi:NTE family protein